MSVRHAGIPFSQADPCVAAVTAVVRRRPAFAAAGLTEFPAGNIEYDPAWADLARAHCNWDLRLLGDRFRKFCRQKDIPPDHLNIARRFAGFCRNLPRK